MNALFKKLVKALAAFWAALEKASRENTKTYDRLSLINENRYRKLLREKKGLL